MRDVLGAFENKADRQITGRDLNARLWELVRLGWRWAADGVLSLSTDGRYHEFVLEPPGGGAVVAGWAESPVEAKRQAVEQAEEQMLRVDAGAPP